jgi:UDP-N-acetylglucosamine transferase subunit ALG13
MIFLTVGAQMPFDRLVHAVDEWASERMRTDVFAQIGVGAKPPEHIEWNERLDPIAFRSRALDAELIVTHAGVGTIITALELGKPIIVMPRRADLRETRNDHQFDTARAFLKTGQVAVAWSELALSDQLDRARSITRPQRIASYASIDLLTALRRFIHGDDAATEADFISSDIDGTPIYRIDPASGHGDRRAA